MKPLKFGAAIAALVLLAAVTIIVVTPAGDHLAPIAGAQSLNCDMSQYKAASGLTAAIEQGALAVTWNGSNGSELRARYAIDNGQPSSASWRFARAEGSGRRSDRISCPSSTSRPASGA